MDIFDGAISSQKNWANCFFNLLFLTKFSDTITQIYQENTHEGFGNAFTLATVEAPIQRQVSLPFHTITESIPVILPSFFLILVLIFLKISS
jgi:hypothetical protein